MSRPAEGVAERARILDAFDRMIVRESHTLSRWPELTWQQLHNRLQWEDGAISRLLSARAWQ
jgi:hypothetical protein